MIWKDKLLDKSEFFRKTLKVGDIVLVKTKNGSEDELKNALGYPDYPKHKGYCKLYVNSITNLPSELILWRKFEIDNGDFFMFKDVVEIFKSR